MKYLIVGLGNIGAEYQGTRHNIGFTILDALAEASNIVFSTSRYGAVAEMRLKNQQLVLLKPSTYMNLSGEAVRYWMIKEKIELDHLLVIVDDIALPFHSGTYASAPRAPTAGTTASRASTTCWAASSGPDCALAWATTFLLVPKSIMCSATPLPRSWPSCPSGPRLPWTRSRPSACRG